MSGELFTFLAGMAPIGELRAAIPLGLGIYKMAPWAAYFWAVLGNIFSAAFVIYMLAPVARFMTAHSELSAGFLNYIFERTRKKYDGAYEKWGNLALVIFVAIPLPMTGAWTAAIIAFLFGIPFWRALFLISAGVAIGGLLVLGASLGVLKLFF